MVSEMLVFFFALLLLLVFDDADLSREELRLWADYYEV